jgi:hypothetical protein
MLDGAISFAFVPLIEWFALRVAVGRRVPHGLSAAAVTDTFFMGNAPWLMWMVAMASIFGAIPPRALSPWFIPLLATFVLPFAWSLWIDYNFLRVVVLRPRVKAIQDLLLLRAIGWTIGGTYFFGIAAWSLVEPTLRGWIAR